MRLAGGKVPAAAVGAGRGLRQHCMSQPVLLLLVVVVQVLLQDPAKRSAIIGVSVMS